MSKNQLYPPLCCIVIVYLFAFFLNIYAFLGVVVIISIYVDRAQENLLRSFTMYADKFHYMTIAATNEVDVATILKNIDPNNKIRFVVNHTRRFDRNYHFIKNNFTKSEMPKEIHFSYYGKWINNGIHMVDLIYFFSNENSFCAQMRAK